MAVAGTLEIQLLANIARLQKDMDDAKRSVGGAMASIEKSVGLAARAFGLLGVSVSLGALVLAAKRINDTVDAMNDLADATGASIENISALDRVARMTGANMDTVGQSLIKFNQALGTTTKAGGDAEKVLTALGLNAKTLRDMDPAEALRQTAVALSQFADDGNKARAVQELFGKSLKEVAPFLKDLAESGQLVATVTTQQALEAEKFNKELFKMQAALTDAGRAMANPMVSGMNLLIEHFRLAKKEGDGFLVTLLKQTEIARLLGVNKPSNGFTDTRESLAQVQRQLNGRRDRSKDVGIQALLAQEQALLAQQASYLSSTAGAGRGVAGYGDLPKGSLVLPPGQAKAVKATKGLTEAEKDLIYHIEWRRKAYLEAYNAQVKADEEATKREQALADLVAKNSREYLDGIQKQIFAAGELIAAAQWELETYGMSRSQIAELTLARLEDAKAQAMMTALTAEDVAGITAQIDAQKRLVEIYRSGEIRDASKKAAEDAAREWQRASEQIEQSLTDALMSGGKSGADYIRDLFRTLVLRPLLSPIGSAMGSAIGSLPGGAAGGGGVLGSLASSGIGQIVMGGTSAFGSGLGAGFGALFGEAGITGALSAGATSIGAGNVMAGLGTIAGALGPIALGVGALASMFDSKGGPKTEGGADLAATIQQQYNGIAAQLGITNKAIFEAFYSKDPQGDSLTQLRVAALSGGRNVFERPGYEDVGRSDAEFGAAVGDATTRAIIAALKDSDLSTQYKQYLDGITDGASTADMERAIALIEQRKALDEEYLTATSTDAQNLARARQKELDAMDPTLRAIKERIWAEQELKKQQEEQRDFLRSELDRTRDALMQGYDREQSALQGVIDKTLGYVDSLRRFSGALNTGPLAALSPQAQYQAARTEFMRLAALAPNDPERMANLEQVGTAFLEASRSYNASSMAYWTDLAQVRAATELSGAAAQTTVEVNRAILDANKAQLQALGLLTDTAQQGFAALVAAYSAAKGAAAAGGVVNLDSTLTNGVTTAGGAYIQPAQLETIMAEAQANSTVAQLYQSILGRSPESSGVYDYYNDYTPAQIEAMLRASPEYQAVHGSHADGLWSVPFNGYRAELHAGERVLTASQARGQDASYAEMVTELRGLRAEVARLTTVSANGMQASLGKQDQIINNTGATAKNALLESTRGVMA